MTHVEVLFEPVGEETRITVTHTGWDSVPQDHVARHTFRMACSCTGMPGGGSSCWLPAARISRADFSADDAS
jgi:hypothetical protein